MPSHSQRYRPYNRNRAATSQASPQDQRSSPHKSPGSRASTRTRSHWNRQSTEDLDNHNSQNLPQTDSRKDTFDQDDLDLFNGGSGDDTYDGSNNRSYKPNGHDGDGDGSGDRSDGEGDGSQDRSDDNRDGSEDRSDDKHDGSEDRSDDNQTITSRTRSQMQLNSTSRETAVPYHMTGAQSQSFDCVATWADLHEDGRILGQKLCNVTGSEEQFHACMVATLSMRQEMVILSNQLEEIKRQVSRIPRGGCDWKDQDHSELKAFVRSIAKKRIMDGDVQAYTAKENKVINEDPLPFCLYGKVMSDILGKPTDWKKEYLPPRYGKDPDNKSSRAFNSLVNTALKEIRKEFETILLQNIKLPDRKAPRVDAAVPVLDSVIVKLYQKEHGVSGQVLVPKEVLDKVGYLRSSRYAWLRMQAIHWGINRNDNKFKYGQ
ncbi:uncharacterized protein MELLADRAFT_89668 [Melampsora larici-populina 98AG31]|uniref:Uncharacterized protein n=1 Tax=Melampsora larici-populina (strain 98AG31 / pathotype 3-4-7) TaxID=747676 RepID=F4RU61_MELLP|nr:uncharacterized protein MELLADRAFT_89668 [Melampsora larici-populina 98AG31]EGG04122.1 hypothetical protein MELLADRAFT_89668 [Melampsora larici-populina 98AG31]